MNRRSVRGRAYKKTTTKQYNVMIREMVHYMSDNPGAKTKGEHHLFWCELRDKLNRAGPPTRNITEWKKVWNDCQRSRKRRELLRLSLKKPKTEPVDEEEEEQHDDDEGEEGEDVNFNDEDFCTNESSKHSLEDIERNPDDSMSSYTIYTTPSESNHQQSHQESVIPRSLQLPPLYRCPPTFNYASTSQLQPPQQPPPQPQVGPMPQLNNFVISNPRTTESINTMNQEILLILKSQMTHQTKLLEHMSQISNNMELLMSRQVAAMERQTEAVRRQALAMEHHTLVMNSFVDMIRDKMPRTGNSNNKPTNLSNGK